MEKQWIKKSLAFLKKLGGLFALYGAIPLVCGAMVGLLFFVQSAGSYNAEKLFAAVGEQSLFRVIGSGKRISRPVGGFYFLSKELLPPGHDQIAMQVGSSKYFSYETKQEAPASPVEKLPDVIYDALPAGATPIISCDLSSASFCINTTNLSVDEQAVRNAAFPSKTDWGKDPLVLVLHTHGTEGYFEDNTNLSDFAPEGVEGYFLPDQTSFRTTDPKKSVVQVGEIFTQTLISCGIPTLHVSTMHDLGDFNSAYTKSGETVKQMLAQYPSIQYVIDLHRDSVVRGDSYVKSFTTVENTPTAQVMLVVGSGKHENWEKNLVVAASFKEQMDKHYPSLSRALFLRTARYNQQYLPGCLLLEVGSAANTLEEAENAARFSALAFAAMLQEE
ncbi:MAG: hypothetical protein E7580_02195 [Ruminococcaceae bacterium]|nr:hypothetical protein [Oscillospiraceae bacterium]